MPFDSKSRAFLAKIETTEGTDAAPVVGTDDLYTMTDSEGIKVNVAYGDNTPDSPYGGTLPAGVASKDATWSLRIPLYGKGLSGGNIVVPSFISAILATLCDVTIGSADSTSLTLTFGDIFAPATTDAADAVTQNGRTFTLYEYGGRDGTLAAGKKPLKIATGCRIAQAVFEFPAQGACVVTLSGPALATEEADVTTDLSGFTADGMVSDIVYGGNLTSTIDNAAGDGPHTLESTGLTVTVTTGAVAYEGDNNGTGFGGTAIDNLRVEATFTAVLAAQSDYDFIADVWGGGTNIIATNSAGVFPAGRATDTGYGWKVDIPALEGPGETVRESPMRFTRNGVCQRATLSGSPVTLTLF